MAADQSLSIVAGPEKSNAYFHNKVVLTTAQYAIKVTRAQEVMEEMEAHRITTRVQAIPKEAQEDNVIRVTEDTIVRVKAQEDEFSHPAEQNLDSLEASPAIHTEAKEATEVRTTAAMATVMTMAD